MIFTHTEDGGAYQLQMLVTNNDDLLPLVVYVDLQTGKLWSCPASEFFDGRFEQVIPDTDQEDDEEDDEPETIH